MRLCFEREAEVIEGGVGLAESSKGWVPKFEGIPSFPVG